MREEPEHEVWRMVPFQIIKNQQHAHRWQVSGQGRPYRQIGEPGVPGCSDSFLWHVDRWCGQRVQDSGQLLLEPRMEHCIRTTGDAFDPHSPVAGMEQGQKLGRSIADIFMRLALWLSFCSPTLSRIRNGLERTGLVGTPGGQAQPFTNVIRLLDQLFLAEVSGSVTSTVPVVRFRLTVPVSHQVRVACQLKPASRRTSQMV
jgi:hypothetical protein